MKLNLWLNLSRKTYTFCIYTCKHTLISFFNNICRYLNHILTVNNPNFLIFVKQIKLSLTFSFLCRFFFFYRSLFGHCVVCISSIYGVWLHLWYLQLFMTLHRYDSCEIFDLDIHLFLIYLFSNTFTTCFSFSIVNFLFWGGRDIPLVPWYGDFTSNCSTSNTIGVDLFYQIRFTS